MTPVEALKIALDKEKAAMQLYQNLAQKYPEIRQLLTDSFNEEFKHKKFIEEKIIELTKY